MFGCSSIISALMRPCYAADKIAEAEAAGDHAAYRFWSRVKADVDAAPPLSPDQRDRLRVLLRRTPTKPSRDRRPKPPDATTHEIP